MQKVVNVLLMGIILLTGIPTSDAQMHQRRFPSTLAGFCLVGNWQAPTDMDTINILTAQYGSATADDVKQWEFDNSDIVTGGFGAQLNWQHTALGYEYWHTIVLGDTSDALRKRSIANGLDYEGFSLHFKQDTIINTTTVGVQDTFWMGRLEAGSADHATHYGNPLTQSDVFRGVSAGGGLFVYALEPFVEIQVSLSRNGEGSPTFAIEYPSAVDADFNITQWSPANILLDTTNGFTQSGIIRIAFPRDWKYAKLYPPHAFYSGYLQNGGGCFALRIRASGFTTRPLVQAIKTIPAIEILDGEPYVGVLHEGTAQAATSDTITFASSASNRNDQYKDMLVKIVEGKGTGQVRLITSYSGSTRTAKVSPNWENLPDNTSVYKIVRRVVRIRGWDPANDRNGDGWVDDGEYANLANPNATARLKHYSRVIHTNAWVSSSAWNVANVWNPDYRETLAQVVSDRWQRNGYKGCYVDDATGGGLGSPWVNRQRATSPYILQGGHLLEYDGGSVDRDDPTGYDWFTGYLQTIRHVKRITGTQWLGANISNRNPFTDTYAKRFMGELDWYLCEDVLKLSDYVDWWGGLMRRPGWIYPAIAKSGGRSFLFAHHANYQASGINTRETWERNTVTLLAYYYMVNIPDSTYILFWNHSYWYGSQNTDTNIYWKAGVPKNIAYQPTRVLKVDIGLPENSIPEGKRPMDLTWYGLTGGDFFKIGDSTSTELRLPDGTVVPTTPTYIYILHVIDPRVRREGGVEVPYDAVYARNYTKGLILYRLAHMYSGIQNYSQSRVSVPLPGTYRVLNFDGTLGPPVNQVEMYGGQGLILVKDDGMAESPQIEINVQTDKANPQPLDVVTVIVTVQNKGAQEAHNVRVRHNIPSEATYVRGSLKIDGAQQQDPVDTSVINLTIPSIPAGGQAIIQFQMVIR
ncbi:MAG: hypothetical protein WHX60_00295 [Armatimonadota bacterium]